MKLKWTILAAFSASFTFFQSCQRLEKSPSELIPQPTTAYTIAEIDAFMEQKMKETRTVFNWESANDDMVFAALQHSGNMAAVGFKPKTATNEDAQRFNAASSSEWKQAKAALVALILNSEKNAFPNDKWSDFTIGDDFDELNGFYCKVRAFETVQLLRKSGMLRYFYPTDYSYEEHQTSNRSESGCSGYNGETLTTADYSLVSPYTGKQSWQYASMGIPTAWSRATGSGIKVMVIDAGFSSQQPLLTTTGFASGGSASSRTVSLVARYPKRMNFWGTTVLEWETSPYTSCGHGTAMSGLVSSPLNNNGAHVGVAYNCNLVGVRACDDVIISNSKDEFGVTSALNLARTTADVKIVSMSLGSITNRGMIGDAVIALKNSGKLLFAAAGTSTSLTSWYPVIYPASMSEAVAVTGTRSGGGKCDVCHDGGAVDLTAVMERSSDDRHVLTWAVSGYAPSLVGGSSAATATVAGVAALVWSKQPTQSAATVLSRLKTTAQFSASPSGNLGYGNVNANAATNF
jgi:serine protease